MKKIFASSILVAMAVILLSASQADVSTDCTNSHSRKSAGPPSCNAGEPPLRTTCAQSGCHEDYTLNSGAAILKLDLGVDTNGYISGQTYPVTVTLSRNGLVRGGFQLVALRDNDSNVTPGHIILTDSIRTQLIDAAHPHNGDCATASKTWIEHTAMGIDSIQHGDSIVWQFNWQAPASDEGRITFYVAAVDANKDLDLTGDYVYSLQKSIVAAPTHVGISNVDALKSISLFPNPASDIVHINLPTNYQSNTNDHITVTNVLGQTVLSSPITDKLPIAQLQKGYYFISINNQGSIKAFRFLKL